MGCTVQGGQAGSASHHAVADCSNLVFYSALYRQPVQIHMFAPGSLADKTSSTVYHRLKFVYKCVCFVLFFLFFRNIPPSRESQ